MIDAEKRDLGSGESHRAYRFRASLERGDSPIVCEADWQSKASRTSSAGAKAPQSSQDSA